MSEVASQSSSSNMPRYYRTLLIILVILSPWIMEWLLVSVVGGNQLLDYIPSLSDEKYHWHQIATFREAGFDGGYYAINERLPNAKFSHFYTYGPLFPMIYGTMGQVLGWEAYSGGVFNLLWLSGALALFIYGTRPNNRQLLMLFFLLATFWPLVLYQGKIMQEGFMMAMAMISAAIFFRVLERQGDISIREKTIFVVFLLLTSLIKGGFWVILFIPLFLISAPRKTLGWLVFEGVKGLAFALLALWMFFQVLQPASNPSVGLPRSLDDLKLTLDTIGENLILFNQGRGLWIVERYQILLLGIYGLFSSLRILLQERQSIRRLFVDRPRWFWEAVFHAMNLGIIVSANVALYDVGDWRDYRIMAPHLLLSVLLLLAFRHYRLVLLVIISNLILVGGFFEAWNDISQPNFTNPPDYVLEGLAYHPEEQNAWCNTLLLTLRRMKGDLDFVTIPAGMGVATVRYGFDNVSMPPKSRYVLVTPEDYEQQKEHLDFELLAETPVGNLYLNHDVVCEE